jgi:hypothetical protein
MANTMELARATRIALGFGNRRDLVEVTDFAHASATYRAAVVASGRGCSTTPQGWVYDLASATPRRIARVSYNGRVWRIKDDALLFDPYAGVAP